MNKALQWMAKNHVAANLLMLFFIIGGLNSAFSLKQEVFPELSMDMIQVSVAYPGAGPEEIEEGILLKIEENLTGIKGLKELSSNATEGMGTVTAEITQGEDPDIILQDIKTEVDRITTFPENAEKPVISKILSRGEVISIVVYGDASEWVLREQAEIIQKELLTFPQITQVDLIGVRPYEISIEIPEENLRRYNITLEQVAMRLRRASLDLPAGTIKTSGGEFLLRTKERRYWGPEYGDITVVVNPDGTQVKLRDIANVKDAFRETEVFSTCNGKPASMIKVSRVGDQKPKEIAEIVKKYISQKQSSLPDSLDIAVWKDLSEIYVSRMNLLTRNAFWGLSLVLVVLGLFLEIRLAMWVMLGIPISVFGAILLMPSLDVSINMISLFGFILVLGILVDDAIVVGENIYEHRQMGKSFLQAATDGVTEVATPVIFSVLTSVVAFIPILFVGGIMGKFIKAIPVIVIALLMVSLVESLFILPAHLSRGRERKASTGFFGIIERIRDFSSGKLEKFVSGPYDRLLKTSTKNRYITVAISIAVLLITVGIVQGGIVKFVFMADVDSNQIVASIKMPPGTPAKETERVKNYVEKKTKDVIDEFDRNRPKGDSVLRHMYTVLGGNISSRGISIDTSGSNANIADVALLLTESEKRGVPSAEIAKRLRTRVGEMPGVESFTVVSRDAHMGANIDIQFSHEDFSILSKAAERIRKALSEYPGTSDIDDTYSKGKQELKIRLRPEARTLGITEEELGRQIRSAFYGAEALRLQRGRNEIKVMVRYPEDYRRKLWNLESMYIHTPGGGKIPLQQAAFVEYGRGFTEINRTERKRVINVTASVDSSVGNSQEILQDIKKNLLPELEVSYPGLTFSMEGEEKERRESNISMLKGFPLAILGIFALLAIPFRSYSQPLLIMTSIPFGIVGSILGHLIMGYPLSMLSFYGLVAMAGVVVNDALLLIDKINRNRSEGLELNEAVLKASKRRFRPIMLTSLTTFFGLAPMLIETSVQAQWLIPMAISLAFGILFATVITLILIPTLYLVLEDLRSRFMSQETRNLL